MDNELNNIQIHLSEYHFQQLIDVLCDFAENPQLLSETIEQIRNIYSSNLIYQSMPIENEYSDDIQIILSDILSKYNISFQNLISKKRSEPYISARREFAHRLKKKNVKLSKIAKILQRKSSTIHNIMKDKK